METKEQRLSRIRGNKYYQAYLQAGSKSQKAVSGVNAIRCWLESGQTLENALNGVHWSYRQLVAFSGTLDIMNKGIDDGKYGFTYINPRWDTLELNIWGYAWNWAKKKYNKEQAS